MLATAAVRGLGRAPGRPGRRARRDHDGPVDPASGFPFSYTDRYVVEVTPARDLDDRGATSRATFTVTR